MFESTEALQILSATRQEILKKLQSKGKTIIIVTSKYLQFSHKTSPAKKQKDATWISATHYELIK
jgi:hypothetical protein